MNRIAGDGSSFKWPSTVALVLSNLVPVFGVLFWHWEVFPIVILFWAETVVIGVFNVPKLLLVRDSTMSWMRKGVGTVFFAFHYGMMMAASGYFVIAGFGSATGTKGFPVTQPPRDGHGWDFGSPDPDVVVDFFREHHLGWAILGLALSHLVSFVIDYLWGGEYRRVSFVRLQRQPYFRLFVLVFAMYGGTALILKLHSPLSGLLVLVVLKIALDLCGHLAERKKFGEDPEANVEEERQTEVASDRGAS